MKATLIGCVILALIAAAVYLLMGDTTISAPAVSSTTEPSILMSLAGDCYALGALMILIRKRWLWISGLAVNTLVIALSLAISVQRPEIVFSPPGTATLITQVLLELGLAYLVIAHARIPRLSLDFRGT